MIPASPSCPSAATPLPELRAELQVLSLADGSDVVIFDPLRHRYFKIDRETAGLLAIWPSCSSAEALVAAATAQLGSLVSLADVRVLVQFLTANMLVQAGSEADWRKLTQSARAERQSWSSWLVHNYLFVKLPLFRPQALLEQVLPWLAPLLGRQACYAVAALGMVGAYLASRQWDVFLATFPYVLTAEGVLLFALALVIVKSLHELGHALVAVKFGCRVPTMGICFMLLVPMLYTDVSDAWRLSERRQRLWIDAAGLMVESGIACVATFLWAFLPEGPMRSLAFALATTSWFLTLALNLNPFMRFDGYYILSDLTGFDNLQSRAFATGRWQMRELLFGLGARPPEPLSDRQRVWLTVYAWGTWVYRAVLFTAIALLVYGIGFKLLGIALFVIEIVYFLAGPVWRELMEWYRMKHEILRRWRGVAFLGLLIAGLGSSLVPLSTTIRIPAVAQDRDLHTVFARRAAVVVATHVALGATVSAGAPVADLASPELLHEIRATELKLNLVGWRLERRAADVGDQRDSLVLEEAYASLSTKLAGLRSEMAALRLASASDGRIVELDQHLAPGRWLKATDAIAVTAGEQQLLVHGYVAESDVMRLDLGRPARFVPDRLDVPSLPVRLQDVSIAGVPALDIIDLSSHYSGGIATRVQVQSGGERALVPISGQFRLTGRADATAPLPQRTIRGVIIAEGKAESLAAAVWRQLLKVLVRESGL